MNFFSFFMGFSKCFRENKLEILCREVELAQINLNDGFILKGHGRIWLNEQGYLYADIVITYENKSLPWGSYIPSNIYDKNSYFTLTAITVGGVIIKSSEIRLENKTIYTGDDKAKRFIFLLMSIYAENMLPTSVDVRKWKRSMQLEFIETHDIPKNKFNQTKSTRMVSHSWNETIIEQDNYIFNLITEDGYSSLYFASNDLDLTLLYSCVTFYIEFTSGKILQPYLVKKEDEHNSISSLLSIDKSQISRAIPPPIQSNVMNNNLNHYNLLNSIIEVCKKDPKKFECIYGHWIRIWHSFQSQADSVHGITLTTSIEGILNDIFIPIFEKESKDESFEKEKLLIVSKINLLDDISFKHKDTICKSIERWGNIYPEKALGILVEKGILTNKEKKDWAKLRHSLAHPRMQALDSRKKEEQSDRVFSCLNIFYKLVLEIYKYDGAYTFYYSNANSKVVHFKSMNLT